MTVKLNSNGDFAEDSATSNDSPNNSHVISDLYDVLQKSETSVQSLAHEFRKSYGLTMEDDSELVSWCDAVRSMNLIEPNDSMDSDPNLGRLFYRAVGYTASEYTDFSDKYTSDVDIRPLDECGDEGEFTRSLLSKRGIVEDKETVNVPVNSNDEMIPLLVLSDEQLEEANFDYPVPTYDQAMERLQTLFDDYLEVSGEIEESNDTNDPNDNSDSEVDHWLLNVDGIGNDVFSNIEEHVESNQKKLHHGEFADPDEWRNSPTVVTKEEASNRLQKVALDMPNDKFTKAMQLIEDGNTNQAVAAISQFE